MFWKIFVDLCTKNNTSPNAVAKVIGISSASVTYWKQGSCPRDTALQKIADHFNVSIDYLLGKEIQPKSIIQDELTELISLLDIEDRAELKGTVKQMLKSDKYKEKDSASNVG
ncbi:MAG: helix-turn-helix domain-containing protein [Clostridia bacterium]|nr:helix-turn-helix domain-containing protein [Clostridia bacterium]